MRTLHASKIAVTVLALVGSNAAAKEPLPIILGAQGFGIQTPAGSGRHLEDVSLEPGWDASLVGHWNFDDGTAGGGTLIGGAAIVKRDKGHALSLEGKGSLKLANAKGHVKPGDSFTVMAWVYLENPGGIVAANEVEGGGYWRLGHNAGFGGKWMFWLQNRSGAKVHTEWHDYATVGMWRHVAAVYDSTTGRSRFYLNGTMVHDAWNRVIEDLAAASSCQLTVGKAVTGFVDDVMLFDRPLSQGQIAALFAKQHDSYFASHTEVYRVTNLNDSGPGSLREGIEGQERARTIVFEVSGTIALESSISIRNRNSYLTVAGATAPSPGITIRNYGFHIRGRANDIFIQHLRFRTGDQGIPPNPTKSQMPDPISIEPGVRNLVVDHCSLSWGTDMNLMTGADDATFSNLITAEALATPLHPKGPHSKGFYVLSYRGGDYGGHRTAVIQNLIAFNADRSPAVSAGSVVIANNYVHACGRSCSIQIDDHAGVRKGAVQASIVANVLGGGSARIALRSGVNRESRFHLSGDNIYNGDVIADPWSSKNVTKQHPWPTYAPVPAHKRAATREDAIWIPDYEPMPAQQVKDFVLAHAGARPAERDPVDERIISNIASGKGKVIASQDDVGGWPELAENRRELSLPDNPDGDNDGNGYTNLEQWLHAFAADVEGT